MCYNNTLYIKGDSIKTLYLIRHAKSSWDDGALSDYERGLSKRGLDDLQTMSSYISMQRVKPDKILSSASLRTQLTADAIAQKLKVEDRVVYMSELYLSTPDMILNVLSLQEDASETIFLVGHNPAFTELANIFLPDNFSKFPTLGVLAIELDIDLWSEILKAKGRAKFFIFPKQFRYYMPKNIKDTL